MRAGDAKSHRWGERAQREPLSVFPWSVVRDGWTATGWGADTFRVNTGATAHTVDSVLTTPGTHRIGGRTPGPGGYAFGGDITAVLAPGGSVTDTLNLYCS